MSLPNKDKLYTYDDYLGRESENERLELIDAVIYSSAAPSPSHQDIVHNLLTAFDNCLKGTPCRAYFAPLDVRFSIQCENDNVVQPDLMVICDLSRFDDKGYKGAPELIVEVVSPSSSRYDRLVKLNLYRRAGVGEYWIVDPLDLMTTVHVLNREKEYETHAYGDNEIISSFSLAGVEVDLSTVFVSPK